MRSSRPIPRNITKKKEAALLRKLGRTIRENRQIRGVTQLSLGLETGLSKAYVCDIEKGRRNPSFTVICRIAKAMGMDPAELLEPILVMKREK